MLLGGAVWRAAIAGFGLADSLGLALACLALAGAADVASVVMRTTIVQLATPEAYRGRVNATDYAIGWGLPCRSNQFLTGRRPARALACAMHEHVAPSPTVASVRGGNAVTGPDGLRGRRGRGYTLISPGNHFASRLPGLPGAHFVKLVTPRVGPSRFGQYLVRAAIDGSSCRLDHSFEHFLFGLEGAAEVSNGELSFSLAESGYAFVPGGQQFSLGMPAGAAVLWIKRRYESWPGLPMPAPLAGRSGAVVAVATPVPGLTRRELLPPEDPSFDFNMSLMRFEPGIGLPQIEIHDEEHGLYVTSGGGVYRLDADEHRVFAGDFIYMAPYCPQGFVADEASGAEYLLYKDVYRDGF
jgi:(S)-ureidoglycine aminohydrolase